MARLVLLVLLLVPLVEVALFILLGGILGLWPTLGLAVATALAGAALIRHQGFAILARAQAELASRRLPVAELFDALCLFLAGALLLTPGFATDVAGGLLLVPGLRAALRALLLRLVLPHRARAAGGEADGAPVIEGEYRDISAEPPPAPREGRGGDGPPRRPGP